MEPTISILSVLLLAVSLVVHDRLAASQVAFAFARSPC